MTALSTMRGQFGVTVQVAGWDDLLDGAVRLYWQRRPRFTEQCGSYPGYRLHGYRSETACPPCRRAAATVREIWRLRELRGIAPRVVRHDTYLCAGHIGLGFDRAVTDCPWCAAAQPAALQEAA